jgi:hypothetical protein
MTKRIAAVLGAVATVVGSVVVVGIAPAAAAPSRWTVAPTAPNVRYGTLAAVACPAPKYCVAVGTQDAAGKRVKLIQRWNGKKWAAQISPNPPGAISSHLTAVRCAHPSSCVAVGQYSTASVTKTLALRWSDNRWTLMDTPNPVSAVSGLSGLACTSATSCIAVGGYFVSSGNESNHYSLAEHWDGTQWTIVPTPNVPDAFDSPLMGVACAAPTDCFAVGYSHTTVLTRPLIQRWDGSSWSIIDSPYPTGSADTELLAVACAAATRCTAVGTSSYGTLVQRWDGTAWSIQPSPDPAGTTGAALTGVSCPSTARCFASGAAFRVVPRQGARQNRLVERLTPTGNAVVKVPVPSDTKRSGLNAMSCANESNCFAVGYYHRGPSRRPLLLRYGP